MPVIIAQCAGKKVSGARAAAFKYDTRTHRIIREFMLAGGYAAGWDWAIMSAEHGIVAPTTLVEDYDATITDADEWASRFACQASEATDGASILFAGSKAYLEALRKALPGRNVQHIGAGGRGCGDYFSALKNGLEMYDEDA